MEAFFIMLLGVFFQRKHEKEPSAPLPTLSKWFMGISLLFTFIALIYGYHETNKLENTTKDLEAKVALYEVSNRMVDRIVRYEIENKKPLDDLKKLEESYAIPRDPWASEFVWNLFKRELRSAGKDKILNTADDVVIEVPYEIR